MGNNNSTSKEVIQESHNDNQNRRTTNRVFYSPNLHSNETSYTPRNANMTPASVQNSFSPHPTQRQASVQNNFSIHPVQSEISVQNSSAAHPVQSQTDVHNSYPNHRVQSQASGSRAVPNSNFPGSSDSLKTQYANEKQLFNNHTRIENKLSNNEVHPQASAPQERLKQAMDTSDLLDLSEKESFYIVRQLKDHKTSFENTVQGPISNSLLGIMMRIVRKICLIDSSDDKIELLKVICCNNFLDTLSNYIMSFPTHQSYCAKEDLLFLEGCVLPFFETILLLLPKLVCHKLRDLLIHTNLAVSGLEQYQNLKVDDDIKIKLNNLESSVKHQLDPEVQQEKEQPQFVKDEHKNLRGGPSQGATQAKHINFVTHNVFPNMIKKLDVPAHKVRGMRKNMYFVQYEQKNEDCMKEGEFLVALAEYLLKQNYKAKNILLLTRKELYMKNICELKNKGSKLKDMTVGVINQCEQFNATITLVSLAVCDSEDIEQNIYEERQLCKALLGAKNGIYMIGNFNILEKQGLFWKEVKSLLQQHEAVSSALPLLCETHQIVSAVTSAEDFTKFIKNGCSRRCEKRLECGHLCRRLCHFDDRDHKYYKCREPCSRKPVQCSLNHKCSKLCHEPCELCTTTVIIDTIEVVCHELSALKKSTSDSTSSHVVPEKRGHMLPCSHHTFKEVESADSLDMWSVELMNLCEVPCSAILQCGHVCIGTCGSCRQGRVHMPCRDRSKITLACGHRLLTTCSSVKGDCEQKCFYECPHGKCKEKCGVPCTPCKEMCCVGCEHSRCTKKCYELCDRRPCFEPCKKLLSCGHRCLGFCGEPCPPSPIYCRVCNADTLKKRDSTGNARFVLLGNCNHAVRSNDLDRRAFNKQRIVEALVCPVCGFNITKTLRYLNYAKELHQQLVTIRHVHKKYQENITGAFWDIAKEIRSLSLPKEIEYHPKIHEIKRIFEVVKENHAADHKTMVLLMFLRNLLYPVVHGHKGMTSPNHLDWFLYLLLERYEMGLCSQVVRELYKEIIEYQKLKGKVYKQYILELHKAIAFLIVMEKNTWFKCNKGHLSSRNSLLTECGTCDVEKNVSNN